MKHFRLKLSEVNLKALREQVYARDGFKCRHCKFRNGLAAHHIIYRSQGGDDASWNLITLCSGIGSPCHQAVHRGDLGIVDPKFPGGAVNADKSVRFVRCNDWSPSH